MDNRGDLNVKGVLIVQGYLKVLGNLIVKGDVHLAKGGELIVIKGRQISGSLR